MKADGQKQQGFSEDFLLAIQAEVAKTLIVIFLCQHRTLQTTLL